MQHIRITIGVFILTALSILLGSVITAYTSVLGEVGEVSNDLLNQDKCIQYYINQGIQERYLVRTKDSCIIDFSN